MRTYRPGRRPPRPWRVAAVATGAMLVAGLTVGTATGWRLPAPPQADAEGARSSGTAPGRHAGDDGDRSAAASRSDADGRHRAGPTATKSAAPPVTPRADTTTVAPSGTPSPLASVPAPTSAPGPGRTAAAPAPAPSAANPPAPAVPAPPPVPAPAPAPPPPPAPAPPPPPAPVDRRAAMTAEIVRLSNVERAAAGLAPLAVSGCATDQAQRRMAVLAAENRFEHDDLGPILGACGAHAVGENIALGYTSAASAVAGWMASSGHRANLLGAGYTGIGVACVDHPRGLLCGQVFVG